MAQSGNPTFNQNKLSKVDTASASKAMTTGGTYLKTFLLLMIVILSATFSWGWMKSSIVESGIRWLPFWIASFATLFLAMAISFNPPKAKLLAIPYAIIQGSLLGIISGTFANSYEGIVGQAIFLTLAVFLAVFVGYTLGLLKATPAFARVIITAMLGILMFSLLTWVFSLFSIVTPVTYSYGTWGVVYSLAIVLVAALSLVLDFDFRL